MGLFPALRVGLRWVGDGPLLFGDELPFGIRPVVRCWG
jgi:hypothetical protein